VTVGPYSPLRIGNSRTVHAVLTRHPQSSPVFCSPRELPIGPVHYLQSSPVICSSHPSSAVLTRLMQSSPITCRARPSSGVTRKIAPPETPVGPGRPSRAWVRTDYNLASVPSKGRTFGVRPVLGKRRTDWTLGNTGTSGRSVESTFFCV